MNLTIIALFQGSVLSSMMFSGDKSYTMRSCFFAKALNHFFVNPFSTNIYSSKFDNFQGNFLYIDNNLHKKSRDDLHSYVDNFYSNYITLIINVHAADSITMMRCSVFRCNSPMIFFDLAQYDQKKTLTILTSCFSESPVQTDDSIRTDAELFIRNTTVLNVSNTKSFLNHYSLTFQCSDSNFSCNGFTSGEKFSLFKFNLHKINSQGASFTSVSFGYNNVGLNLLSFECYCTVKVDNCFFINNTIHNSLIYLNIIPPNNERFSIEITNCQFARNIGEDPIKFSTNLYDLYNYVLSSIEKCIIDATSFGKIPDALKLTDNEENYTFDDNDVMQWKIVPKKIITMTPTVEFYCAVSAFQTWTFTPDPTESPTISPSISPSISPTISPIPSQSETIITPSEAFSPSSSFNPPTAEPSGDSDSGNSNKKGVVIAVVIIFVILLVIIIIFFVFRFMKKRKGEKKSSLFSYMGGQYLEDLRSQSNPIDETSTIAVNSNALQIGDPFISPRIDDNHSIYDIL